MGVPPVTKCTPGSDSNTRSGTSSVSELLAPLRFRSGATIVVLASGRQGFIEPHDALGAVAVIVANKDLHGETKPKNLKPNILKNIGPLSVSEEEPMAAGDGEDRREAELALFREAMRGVRRLGLEPRQTPTKPLPRPRALFTRADRRAVLRESLADLRQPLAPVVESGEELLYRRNGVQEQVFRRLRSGHYRVEAELDLHGLIVPQAEAHWVPSWPTPCSTTGVC